MFRSGFLCATTKCCILDTKWTFIDDKAMKRGLGFDINLLRQAAGEAELSRHRARRIKT